MAIESDDTDPYEIEKALPDITEIEEGEGRSPLPSSSENLESLDQEDKEEIDIPKEISELKKENEIEKELRPEETKKSSVPEKKVKVRKSPGRTTIDPITHTLWATENGPDQYDEINIVKPGFNSGWQTVMGPISREGKSEEDLFKLPGSHYSDPLLSWKVPPALTGIEFLNSSKLGTKYMNNIFVGDYNGGNLYFFRVNDQRNDLKLVEFGSALSDRVVDNNQEFASIIFGTGFGGITDIKTSSDGLLYILSIGDGAIYRIVPV